MLNHDICMSDCEGKSKVYVMLDRFDAVMFVKCKICAVLMTLQDALLAGKLREFHKCRWGSSLPGLRTLDPPLGAPSTLAEIFRRTGLQSHLQTSPQPLRRHIRSFGTLGQLLEIPQY